MLGNKLNVMIDPKAPIGTANNTENGTDQLSYKAARKRNTNTSEIAKFITGFNFFKTHT